MSEGGKGGWKADGLTAEAYLAELEAYDAEISKDPYVLGAVVFTAGPSPDWANFDVDPLCDHLRGLSAGWTPLPPPRRPDPIPIPPPPMPTPEGEPVPDVVLSFPSRVARAYYFDEDTGNYSIEPLGTTVGCVIHSSGGKAATLEEEYAGTWRWFQNPASGVSAHRVIGPHEVCASVPDSLTAYHARSQNSVRRGIEFAHPDTPAWARVAYLDFQYEAAGELIARWHLRDGFPIRFVTDEKAPGLIHHRNTLQGRQDGKRDPTGPFSEQRLIDSANRWVSKLKGGTVPTDLEKLQDETWTLCDRLQALAGRWKAAGWPSAGSGIASNAEAVKSLVRASKGER